MEICADLVAGTACGNEFEPFLLGTLMRTGDDLNDVAVVQLVSQRCDGAVGPRAGAVVTDFGVDRIREVDRRGTARKHPDVALGRRGFERDCFRLRSSDLHRSGQRHGGNRLRVG